MLNKQEKLKKLFGDTEPKTITAYRSKVQQYATCPFQAWKCQDLEEHSVLLDVGDEVHKIGEDAIREAIENHTPPDELAENIVDVLPQARPDIQPQIIKAARFLADQILELRVNDILGVEIQVDDAGKTGLTTMKGERYILSACLDLLLKGRNNSLHVWDWKSGFKKRTKEDTFNDFQSRYDSNILFKMYDGSNGDRIERIHWWFIETFWGTKSYACFERDQEYSSLPHLTLERQIEGQIFEAIKLWASDCREAWPEEKKCSWCPCVLECPHLPPYVKDIAKGPKAFIDQMVVLKAALDKCKKIAKSWLQEYGPIEGTDMIFEWRPSKKFTPNLYKKGDKENNEKSE